MLKKILTPLDGTPAAEAGLFWAKQVAARSGAAIHLLTAVEDAGDNGADGVQMARQYLEAHRDSIQSQGLAVSLDVLTGSAAELIVASAADAELTVMTYGTSRWLFGGVLDMVLREMTRPLVIVRAAAKPRPAVVEMRRILLPLDTAQHSMHVPPAALQLARNLGASVVLCHVVAPLGTYQDAAQAPPGVARIIDELLDSARQFLDQAAVEARSEGVAVEVAVSMGQAAPEIARLAERYDAGLIAMATRGSGRLSRVLGSVAYAVAQHGRVPCLLTPSPNVN